MTLAFCYAAAMPMSLTSDLPIDVYARVSLSSDPKMATITGQCDVCRARLEDLDLPVGETLYDNSKSAWNEKVKRPDWEKAMQRMEQGVSGGVIVFDMARWSRKPKDGERLIEAAKRGLLVLDSEDAYDLTTANGRKTFRDHLNAAAYESDRLSTRVKRGKATKVKNGETNHSNRPFGFEQDGMTPREPEATQVREAVEWVANGGSLKGLVAKFNSDGIRTSFGNDWTFMSMRELLKRPRNAGIIAHNGEEVGRFTDSPLVDEETWRLVVSMFAARRRGRPLSDTYLATGLVACGRCGVRMYGKPYGDRTYADGVEQRRYVCSSTNGGCGRIAIDWRATDAAIADVVLALLADEELVTRRKQANDEAGAARAHLRHRIEVIEANQLEISGRFGRGEMELAEYDAITGPMRQQLLELRAQLEALPVTVEVDAELSHGELLEAWNAGDITRCRALARRAIGASRMFLVQPADPNGPRRFDYRRLVLGEWQPRPSRLIGRVR